MTRRLLRKRTALGLILALTASLLFAVVLPAYQASADIVLGAGSSLGPGQQLCTYSDFGNVCLVNQST